MTIIISLEEKGRTQAQGAMLIAAVYLRLWLSSPLDIGWDFMDKID